MTPATCWGRVYPVISRACWCTWPSICSQAVTTSICAEDCRTLLPCSRLLPCRVGSPGSRSRFQPVSAHTKLAPLRADPGPIPRFDPRRHPLNRSPSSWTRAPKPASNHARALGRGRADPRPGGLPSAASWTPQTLMSLDSRAYRAFRRYEGRATIANHGPLAALVNLAAGANVSCAS